jgi:hypothetical protein
VKPFYLASLLLPFMITTGLAQNLPAPVSTQNQNKTSSFYGMENRMIDKDFNLEFYTQSQKDNQGNLTGQWNIVLTNNDNRPIQVKALQTVRIKGYDVSEFSHTAWPKGEISLDTKMSPNYIQVAPNGTLNFNYDLKKYFNHHLKLPHSVYQQHLNIELVLVLQTTKGQIFNRSFTYIMPLDVNTSRI